MNKDQSLIERFERKFSWLAVPRLLSIIACLQVLVFFIILLRGPEAGGEFAGLLSINPLMVSQGEVWRMFTYVLLPDSNQALFVLFGAYVLHITGMYLEISWGAFRLTLFFLATTFFIAVGMMLAWRGIISHPEVAEIAQRLSHSGIFQGASFVLFGFIAMILGVKCPQIEWRLYFLISVSSAILGWLAFAGLAWALFASPMLRLPIAVGGIPFLLVALPRFYTWYRLKQKVWGRRTEFMASNPSTEEPFAKCVSCGRNDTQNPELTFRVAADGQEYCVEHLPPANP